MSGVNKYIVVGRLGSDPEERGSAVTSFSVATSEHYTDKTGAKQEKTEWHDVVAFGKLAESCAKYLAKGSQVYVEGQIETNDWEDKEGNKRQSKQLKARTVQFLDSKKVGGSGESAPF